MVTLDREHILALPANLSYRLAVDGDLDQLRDYRLECGWGLERLERFWGSPDRPLCVFSIVDQGGRAKDVGMGGWILELEDDGEAASREYGSVQLSSLFIRQRCQNLGLGNLAMDILEHVALTRFHAKWITLDTGAHPLEIRADGQQYEVRDQVGRSIGWYQSRGYRIYRKDRPKYHIPSRKDPGRMQMATFMRKSTASLDDEADSIVLVDKSSVGNGQVR